MGQALYNLVIFPLETVIEVLFLVFQRVSHSPGLAVLGVSVSVNVLSLPLYAKAESWQALERGIRARLKPKVDDIKAVFKGDERLMILSTYYRQNGYHPVYALRSSFGLLLQIPFFIAAYAFIKNLPELRGQAFFVIRDLSLPDALLALGPWRINLLPVAMTLVNLAASAVYAKGFSIREKVQLYAMALVFLVLLYDSPSALVLYWTFNNVFSLCKNLSYKTKRPMVVLYLALAVLAVLASVAVLFILDTTNRKRLLVVSLSILVVVLPLLAKAGARILDRWIVPSLGEAKRRFPLFATGSLATLVLLGAVVPLSLIASSPQEFSFLGEASHPLSFVALTLFQLAGFVAFWPGVLYALFGPRARALLTALMLAVLACVSLNVFVFGGDYGTISRALAFPDPALLRPRLSLSILNLASLACACGCILLVLALRRSRLLATAAAIGLFSLTMYAGYTALGVHKEYLDLARIRASENMLAESASPEPVYTISTNGRNVLVLMLDRAISAFVPDMLEADPSLALGLDGFTWYPNTLSFNGHTLPAAPPLFGGYDYVPDAMNARAGEPLVDKHDEALALLPRMFAEAGWLSAISDASWAHYSWVPDNNVFARYAGVSAFNVERRYTSRWLKERGYEIDPSASLKRNLSLFSLFKALPMALRFGAYDGGKWWDSEYRPDSFADFIDKYAPIDYLPSLVSYRDAGDSFILMANNATHEAMALRMPEYVPVPDPPEVLPERFGDAETERAFGVQVAVFRRLAALFADMKRRGVWDDTRVVIVSDHGGEFPLPAFSALGDRAGKAAMFNPLLLVKDFGASGPLAIDRRFGTNADVPAIAVAGLMPPVNPFSGKPVAMLPEGAQVRVLAKSIYDPSSQPRNTFSFGEEDIVTVKDDIFAESNWGWKR